MNQPICAESSSAALSSEKKRSLIAIIMVGVTATIILGIIPIFVAGMVAELGLGDKEVGSLASADMFGSTIASLVCLSIQGRYKWHRILYFSLLVAIGGNLLAVLQTDFWALMACRVLAGFGNGFIIALVFIALCHSRNPDRGFGFYTLGQIGLQTVLLTLLPHLIQLTGMAGVYIFLATASLASALLIRHFPSGLDATCSKLSSEKAVGISTWALLALAALTAYFLAAASIWGYFEPIGNGFELTLVEVGEALGAASLFGIAGPLTVVIIATKFGRMPCLIFGIFLHLFSVLMLIYGSGYLLFFVAASLFAFAFNYSFPYQMGILSTFDKDGSIAVIALVLQLGSFTLGPILASFLLFGGYSAILWVCQISFGLSLMAYWVSALKGKAAQ